MSKFSDAGLDPELVSRARRGDREAHSLLFRRYSTPVYTLACRILQRPALADDVLQETFIEVFRKLDGYRGDAPLGMWIRRIAVNKCLMYLRSAWHRRMRSEEVLGGCGEAPDGGPGGGVSHRVPDNMDLTRALASIPHTARAVVWLHDVEGYTHREIGALMGKTASFSKSQLARAHARLRAILDSDGTNQCMQVSNSY